MPTAFDLEDYNHFMKCLIAAAWMSKRYPILSSEPNVKSLQNLAIEKLTNTQKTYLVSECSSQFPYIVEQIMKETRMNYDRVVFDIQWMRKAIRQNTVSSLVERCPMIFNR